MYSTENIQLLFDRLGWRNSDADKLTAIVSAENKLSNSGRYFEDFSPIITLKRLYDCLEEAFLNDSLFNLKLTELNTAVVYEVLDRSFNYNSKTCQITDRNECIISNEGLFDEALGYGMAIKVIDIMLSSHRENISQVKVEESYNEMMVQLNGFFDDGKVVVPGLTQKYDAALKKLSECLVGYDGIIIKDATHLW